MKNNQLKKDSASMTVEAALVLPIFLFAMITIAYLGQMIKCQDEIQWALTRVAREASAEYGAGQSSLYKSRSYYQMQINRYIKHTGISISLLESRILTENDEIDLIASYKIQSPFPAVPVAACRFRQRVHTRAFTGVGRRDGGREKADCVVYVTETGRVYHRRRECTYLKLSISQIKYQDVGSMRNEGGGRYKPCERCCRDRKLFAQTSIWIANYGDRFHTSRSCSGIKRSIREIPISEVGKRTPCSKCGREEGE